MNDVNLDKIMTDVSVQLIKEFTDKVVTSISGPIKRNLEKFSTDFSEHLEQNYRRNKFVRILCHKHSPLELEDIYVPGYFKCGEKVVTDQELMQFIRDNRKVIIKGDGGLGKTFFVKKLWCAIFDEPNGRVPIFISLRELNELTDLNLLDFVRLTIMPSATHSKEIFEYFCMRGDFIFIFDGFDEVVQEKRKILQNQLNSLTRLYPQCGFVISSRETGKFNPWADFHEYQVTKFNLDQTRQLIENIPYSGNKTKFLKRLSEDYFKENESFLSNPLLAIMMLMTFNDNPVSNKKSIFYENAFQTLYSLHDSLKEGAYERERELDKDLFRRVFSHFCLFSYYKEMISFSEAEIREQIGFALKYLEVDANIDNTIKEFCESTNLMQFEGLTYFFIHRSFQEFFAAECATKEMTENFSVFINEFLDRRWDQTYNLAYEIHPKRIQQEILIPLFGQLKSEGYFEFSKNKDKRHYFLELTGFELEFFNLGDDIEPRRADIAVALGSDNKLYMRLVTALKPLGIIPENYYQEFENFREYISYIDGLDPHPFGKTYFRDDNIVFDMKPELDASIPAPILELFRQENQYYMKFLRKAQRELNQLIRNTKMNKRELEDVLRKN